MTSASIIVAIVRHEANREFNARVAALLPELDCELLRTIRGEQGPASASDGPRAERVPAFGAGVGDFGFEHAEKLGEAETKGRGNVRTSRY